ncbi:hypothetical protein HBH98_250740 [Parastagonospora nodorum]|nr:hypothetical protein HBH98_250740 [Parastagonospora nodorum]KAH4367583.1 hypothetical protein HBH99_250670 [Parastagonospora nodorum]
MLNLASLLSLTALLNLQLLALKRLALSSSDLNRRHTNLTIATSLAKQIKTNEDRKKSTHCQGFNSSSSLKLQKTSDDNNVQLVRDNIEELIYISKVKHTYVQAYTVPYLNLKKYLSNSTENLANVADVFDIVISKLDKVPTQELSSYIKTELYLHQKQALYFMLCDNSRKFYRLIITSKDTHYKQTIKKAYIMSPERALLILFIT